MRYIVPYLIVVLVLGIALIAKRNVRTKDRLHDPNWNSVPPPNVRSSRKRTGGDYA